jgi:hypothetical protein
MFSGIVLHDFIGESHKIDGGDIDIQLLVIEVGHWPPPGSGTGTGTILEMRGFLSQAIRITKKQGIRSGGVRS